MFRGLMRVLMDGIFYWVFLGVLATDLYQRHLYRGVEHWPSVPAFQVRTGSGGGGFPVTNRDGQTTTTSPVHRATFEHEVNGRKFYRDLSSHDSMQLRGWNFSLEGKQGPRAYYQPERPEIAC